MGADKHVLLPHNYRMGLGDRAHHAKLNVRDSAGNIEKALDLTGMVPDSNTDGLIKAGTLSSPLSFGTADQFMVKLFGKSTATSGTFTLARFRGDVGGAGGSALGVLAQGGVIASTAAVNVFGLRAEAIAKSAATVSGIHTAVYAKVEDARATDGTSTAPTLSGRVSIMELYGQISADPTGGYYGITFDFHSTQGGVTTSQSPDALMYVLQEGQWQTIGALLKTQAAIATWGATSTQMISSGSLTTSGAGDVACDARIRVDLGGTSHWIPLFNTAA